MSSRVIHTFISSTAVVVVALAGCGPPAAATPSAVFCLRGLDGCNDTQCRWCGALDRNHVLRDARTEGHGSRTDLVRHLDPYRRGAALSQKAIDD